MNRSNALMLALYDNPRGLCQSQLSTITGLSKSNLSPSLIALVEHGLVHVERGYPDNNHKVKKKVYTLTMNGHDMAEVMSRNRDYYVRRFSDQKLFQLRIWSADRGRYRVPRK